MIATMDNNMKSISCYVLSTRLEKVLELFCEDGGRFDLVIERGCKRIGAQNWRCVLEYPHKKMNGRYYFQKSEIEKLSGK